MLAILLPVAVQAAQVEISVGTAFPEYLEMHKAIGDAFMKTHPDIHIKYEPPAKDYDELLQRTMRDAITGAGPDVIYESYNFVPQVVDRKLAAPLDDFIAKESDWAGQGYLPNVTTMAQANGKVYGLPFNTSIPFIYYNVDLMKKAGWDSANLPKTWSDVVKLSKAISGVSGPGTGMYFDYYYIVSNLTFDALLKGQGTTMMSPDMKKITFDGLEGMTALETLQQFGANGMMDTTRDQAVQSFRAGMLGMYASTSSYINSFRKAGVNFVCSPFPVSSDKGQFPAGGNAGMIMTKNAARQKAAWEYLKFASGDVGQFIVAKTTGYVPTNSKVLDNPEFKSGIYADPCFKSATDELPRVTGPFTFPGQNAQRAANALRDIMRDVVTQKQTPAQAMPQMVDAAKKLINN